VLKTLLDEFGFSVQDAANGREGVEVMDRFLDIKYIYTQKNGPAGPADSTAPSGACEGI
jgi:hypothetical protein